MRQRAFITSSFLVLLGALILGVGGCGGASVSCDSCGNQNLVGGPGPEPTATATVEPTVEPTVDPTPAPRQASLSLSTIPTKLLSCPSGDLPPYQVKVLADDGLPLEGASVVVKFNAVAMSHHQFCASSKPVAAVDGSASFSMTTDASGDASIQINGGGCSRNDATASISVLVNGVVFLPNLLFMSADYDAAVSGIPTLDVGLSDASFYTPIFSNGTQNMCADITMDGLVALADATALNAHLSGSHSCPF